ncbi:phosphodiesterase [Clostridium carboxidivorans P7]|uniref:Type I phosphodiesterase/nucleotide pyrophosphatase n=1 Tax=Clostridium carboxidivorans P7 TaxID=536227 RepID=C6PVL7_9CLOT|nr:ectonucleotide pyrophosphatase/phosphodiesterase [Clostridium carboxidivorans]AKN30236.1 phosphodiesterase [Clostridium carboxidivorans P7]EET86714.1 type I phosphodiesterase/nucleotide pyrophosphatase [Clostridium carboxidivorans P7]
MKRISKHLIVVSFDGLSTLDFEIIQSLPNFKKFIDESSYCKNVYSVYPTLTYPAHVTIVTGKYPKNHGIINNTLLQPGRRSPDWYWQRKYVKGETLYDIAIDSGMKVAALLWPVTAKSSIQYNMPEIFANRPWQNQIMVSLFNGSPLFQISLNNRFGALRDGIRQPNLDNFTHESLLYTIKEKKPDLILVHYTDLDTMRHHHGFNSKEAEEALKRHDRRLGDIIETLKKNNIYDDSTIIALGDHSSIDEDKIINLNILLKENGYIKVDTSGNIIDYKAIVKNCDGSAYVYVKDIQNKKLIYEIRDLIDNFNKEHKCIEAVLTKDEARGLGADPQCAMMLEANRGYYFLDHVEGEIIKNIEPHEAGRIPDVTNATHGYSPFKEEYTTVFMAAGCGIKKGAAIEKMNLVDEGPTMAKLLGLELKDVDGRIIEEILE